MGAGFLDDNLEYNLDQHYSSGSESDWGNESDVDEETNSKYVDAKYLRPTNVKTKILNLSGKDLIFD